MPETKLELTIIKPNLFKREYHFLRDQQQVGTITTAKALRLEAVAHFADEEWKLSQTGWWRPYLHYQASHRPFTKGKLHPGWTGQVEMPLANGLIYQLKRQKWFHSKWGWYDKDRLLLELRPDHGLSKKQAHITIYTPADPQVWLLVSIAFYMFILRKRQATAST